MNPDLPLRDIHLPADPGWWPPAPGWWILVPLIIALMIWLSRILLRWKRARAQQAATLASFDAAILLPDAHAQLSAISELLRRAATWHESQAGAPLSRATRDRKRPAWRPSIAPAQLQGEEWLRYLDGEGRDFSSGPGRILIDGMYRRELDPDAVEALHAPARRRFRSLIGARS